MPASYPLLCTFIGEYKGRQARNTICSWLSSIHTWHVINHAPWFGDNEWVQLACVSANKEGTKHKHPLPASVFIEHLLALRHSDGQGFVNPHGFAGKGSPGTGRGHSSVTLTKPLPATWVWGYPWFSGRVK